MATELRAELDIREKLAQIDRTLSDRDRKRQEIQEIRYAPWLGVLTISASLMAAGAAFFAAGAVFMKLLQR